jgi:hypothetical protein
MTGPLHAPRHIERWLAGYARQLARRWREPFEPGPRHLLLSVCDHYEPLWGGASARTGLARVERWTRDYPLLAEEHRDADGRPPRHTFFYPAEQYRPELLDALGRLARAGLGEVELHLHHDGDSRDGLSERIRRALDDFAEHGHLSTDARGTRRYGFIHGNWCLANSRRDGRWCGVDAELAVLFETGCFADFTFPSAPDETQPRVVNQIYWPTGDLGRARAHERGVAARVGAVMRDRILIIEGPLCLSRGGRFGVRLETGALSERDPATRERAEAWLRQRIHVVGRPNWVFVKLHTHGAPERQATAFLGGAGRALYRSLASECQRGELSLHFVTAREMFNIAMACMEGRAGDPGAYRDYLLPPPVVAS